MHELMFKVGIGWDLTASKPMETKASQGRNDGPREKQPQKATEGKTKQEGKEAGSARPRHRWPKKNIHEGPWMAGKGHPQLSSLPIIHLSTLPSLIAWG